MVRTDVHAKLMGLLVQGDPISDRQLTRSIGFQNPRNIAKHLASFVNSGYIMELPREGNGPGNWYQLTTKKEGLLNLYQSKFFKGLRVRIRHIPWFIDEIAEGYRDLNSDLYPLIVEMMQKSHSFFMVIARYPSHEHLISAYSLYLFPCRLFRKEDPLFQSYFLYAQIYAESVIKDIEKGGLAEGFLDPLEKIKNVLLQMTPDTKDKRLPIMEPGCQDLQGD